MPRAPDSAHLDLSEVFRRVQHEMLASLSVGRLFEHASTAGAATEHHWLEMFHRYLPTAYRAAPAFVIDSTGRRSRQIDIAIFDQLHSPQLFPHASGVHVPAESVYAVFEVKPTFSRQWLRDAADKAASVRALRRNTRRPQPILAGLLAAGSVWSPSTFAANLHSSLEATPLDIGCCLQYGAFVEQTRTLRISSHDESLIFFVLRLLERLRAMGPAPAIDLMQYARSLAGV
jgi:hypothetical protein